MLPRGTFSIVAADLEAGEVGCAVQSKYFSVGSVVPWAAAGVGAVATQAAGVAVYGRRALEELAAGAIPEEALERVLAGDSERETRQLGVVAADGRAAAFTGSACLDWAGHRVGAGFAAQGNILAGEEVVEELARAFEETVGPLVERLVASLEAGQAVGGDRRGQQSAALVVERVGAASDSREGVAVSRSRTGAPGRRVGSAAQPRDDGRKPAAADALPLLPGRDEALQQARAGQRLPRTRG